MSDLLSKQQAFHVFALTGVYWLLAFATPFMLVLPGAKPDAWTWCVFLVVICYFGYTGMRAWRRGWKSRFILRVVVPGVLFVTAWVVIALVVLSRRPPTPV